MGKQYTKRARRAIYEAQESAARSGMPVVEIDHLLMGILTDEDTVAARLLIGIGCSREALRERLEMLRVSRASPGVRGEMTLGATAKTAIDHAHAESKRRQNTWIGTEHLLIGVIAAAKEPTRSLFKEYGVGLESVRAELTTVGTADAPAEATPHAPPASRVTGAVRGGLSWQVFTQNTRDALLQAQREAAHLGGNVVWPEHLLLGLLRAETGVARTLLLSLNVTSEELIAALEPVVSRGPAHDVERPMQLHPKARAVLEAACKEAGRNHCKWVGTEHLLVAVIAVGGEPADSLLRLHGIRLDRTRRALDAMFSAPHVTPSVREGKATVAASPSPEAANGPVRLRTREKPGRQSTPQRVNILALVIALMVIAVILRLVFRFV
jgi:ATP-dependent Clp protease ATP-binding subunit ClpA